MSANQILNRALKVAPRFQKRVSNESFMSRSNLKDFFPSLNSDPKGYGSEIVLARLQHPGAQVRSTDAAIQHEAFHNAIKPEVNLVEPIYAAALTVKNGVGLLLDPTLNPSFEL